ncbi:MAG: tripartite tricarboxylate transporter substrate binding protein [Deltaproteobacteria bacterium]|nr:tripartite tricarboxylate transporter substrate binding protein [Deltaproteobacteria bacterium]
MKKRIFTLLLVTGLTILFAGLVWSQAPKPKDYPTRAIEVVVQYGAGGGSDIFVRSLMMPARSQLKVPINVTNLTGGAGVKASTYVLSQPADGYTIYNFSPEQLINTVFGRENYKEFVPLCNVQQDQSVFYVRAESPFKTIQDVIKYAKENPGKLQFTGTTAASPDEVIIMLFAKKAGIKVKYIPFDAAPETHAAVLGGHIDLLHEEPGVIMSLIEAKRLRPLIAFTEKRLDKFPDVPTARELGYDITMGRWRGLCVKKGTPQEIINYLSDVLKKCSQDPSYKAIEKANLLDLRPGWKGPEEYGKFWDEEYVNYRAIFDELGYLKKK